MRISDWSSDVCSSDLVQPGTSRGTFLMTIGSRKTTPPRILRIVPFGDFHIFLRLNSSTRASSGVMVAHLTPTPYLDRKSVVLGKSVSVRVDLGGSRLIKKKKKN